MNGLHVLDEKKAGLLDRLRGRRPKENASIALNNYVATTPLADINGHEISRILTEHQCRRQDVKPALAVIYTQVLNHFAQDRHLSAQEQSDLAQLRSLFGLTADEADALDAEVLSALYQQAVHDFFADGHFTFREREQLERLSRNFHQDEAETDTLILNEAFRTFEQGRKPIAAVPEEGPDPSDGTAGS